MKFLWQREAWGFPSQEETTTCFLQTAMVFLLWAGTRGRAPPTEHCGQGLAVGKHYFGSERAVKEGQGVRTKESCQTGKWRGDEIEKHTVHCFLFIPTRSRPGLSNVLQPSGGDLLALRTQGQGLPRSEQLRVHCIEGKENSPSFFTAGFR